MLTDENLIEINSVLDACNEIRLSDKEVRWLGYKNASVTEIDDIYIIAQMVIIKRDKMRTRHSESLQTIVDLAYAEGVTLFGETLEKKETIVPLLCGGFSIPAAAVVEEESDGGDCGCDSKEFEYYLNRCKEESLKAEQSAALSVESSESANASMEESARNAAATKSDREQVSEDAEQAALDRIQTGKDAATTSNNATQTNLDAESTAADRIQAGKDAAESGENAERAESAALATAADREQVSGDAEQVAADRIQTGKDAESASNSETESAKSAAESLESEKNAKESEDAVLAAEARLLEFAGLMTESEARAIQSLNENKYAASGMVHSGQGYQDGVNAFLVNEGMWTNQTVSNVIRIGRGVVSSGESKTTRAQTHIAGSAFNALSDSGAIPFTFQFPQAPDGTVTYNKSTGENIKHPDVATAFALADSDADIEVVTHPVDLAMLEYYEEELTGRQEVFECIQSLSTTFGDTDVPTVLSTRPLSYFQQYDGQFPDPALQNDQYRCVVWSDLTDEQKRKVAAYMGEKLFVANSGNIKNGKLWATTKRGLGNGDWFNIDSTSGALEFESGIPVLSRNGYPYVKDETRQGVFTDGNGCFAYVVATVPRANQGIYVKGVNEYGTAKCSDDKYWYESANTPTTLKDCFIGQVGGDIASGKSGHQDGIFYDGIEAGGLNGAIDWRLSAYPVDTKEDGSKGFSKVVDGSYRGLEKLVKTEVYGDEHFSHATNKIVKSSGEYIFYVDFASTDLIGEVISGYNPTTQEIVSGVILRAANDSWLTIDSAAATLPQGSFTPITTASGGDAYAILTTETNLSVSGEFNTQMVIGDPANILLTDALKNGWLGTWCPVIPDTTEKEYPLTRKAITPLTKWLTTTDLGVSWANYTTVPSGWSSITNSRTSTVAEGHVYIYIYTAFAKQTKPSTNKPVLNGSEGLGDVFTSCNYRTGNGVLLGEALLGKVMTNGTIGLPRDRILQVTGIGFHSSIRDIEGGDQAPTHIPLMLAAPTNNSPAVKALWYMTSDNGQVGLNFAYNELIYNDSWGDDSTARIIDGQGTYINLNGDTCLYGSNELAIPLGWSQNKARFGTVTDGVDQ
ncbi:coil containing protein [Vibrio phage 1.259.O._10N.286.48.F4]|nr:coil containing protein [Vibrio phage 1.259.O._10N.286.48.F4]